MRRSVRARRSLGTGVNSVVGPPHIPPPPTIRPPPRAAPPVAARVPPPRGNAMGAALPGRRGRGFGDPLGLEPAFGVDGRLAPVPGRGHGLAIAVIVDVARDEHAFDDGL